MKVSKYNFFKKVNNSYYVVNILHSTFFELSKEQYFYLKSKKNVIDVNNKKIFDSKTYEELINRKIIIKSNSNELKEIENAYNTARNSRNLLTITIAPTLSCNFRCPYCYENKNNKTLNQNSQIKIINFIENQFKLGYKNLNLIWFGGEPLLCYEIIKNMSIEIIRLCEEYNVEYNAFLTTNGYLLNDDIIENLKNLRINQLYITVDGMEKVHNSRRHLIDGGETFEKIVCNLKKLKNKNINTIIRMNIDKTNFDDIKSLHKFISKELNLPMYLGLVRKYTDSCINLDVYYDKKEYAHILNDFNARDKKISRKRCELPRPKDIYCRACKVGTFVIDPDLNLYKCENDIGRYEKRISSIDDYPYNDEKEKIANKSYYKWNPFDNEICNNCKLLPICIGGCPYIGIKNSIAECEVYKYNIDNTIRRYLLDFQSKDK